METIRLEEQTLLVCMGIAQNFRNLSFLEYKELWENYDYNKLPILIFKETARNVIKISKIRQELQSKYHDKENNIFVDTLAFVATKMFNYVTERFSEEDVPFALVSAAEHAKHLQYCKQKLQICIQKIKKESSLRYLREYEQCLHARCKEYEHCKVKDFEFEIALTKIALVNLSRDLDEARYSPLDAICDALDIPLANYFAEREINEAKLSSKSSVRDEGDNFPISIGSKIEWSWHGVHLPGTIVAIHKHPSRNIPVFDLYCSSDGSIGDIRTDVRMEQFRKSGNISMRRWASDLYFKDNNANKWGELEQKLITVHLGIDKPVDQSGRIEKYCSLWLEDIDFTSLPTSVLNDAITEMKKIIQLREDDMHKYIKIDEGHLTIYYTLLLALENAESALNNANPREDAKKMEVLNVKRCRTLSSRKARMDPKKKYSKTFQKLNELLELQCSEVKESLQRSAQRSTQRSTQRSASAFSGRERERAPSSCGSYISNVWVKASESSNNVQASILRGERGSRAISDWDYYRSNVWEKGSGSRRDMTAGYHNWKTSSSGTSWGSGSGSGGAGGHGSGSGGSLDLSNIILH